MIVAGGGIRHSETESKFLEFIDRVKIPVVLSYASKDLLDNSHELNLGVMGQFGNSSANLMLQNADLIIGLGTRFNIRQAGNDVENFAKNAKKY